MINALPIIGWLISGTVMISMAVPFWICWTWSGIGAKFFYFVPEVYQDISFWNCVGVFIVLSILKAFIPKLADVSAKVEKKS